MPRPDPSLLDPSRYPFACEVTTRFADIDPNRHLNNVAIAAILEDVRVRFNATCGMELIRQPGDLPMVANVSIDYLAQGSYPAPMRGVAAVEALGRSSWTVVQLATQDGVAVAFARSVIVATHAGHAQPLPAAFRERLEQALLV